jgi:Tol biopolymer transport system component
MSDLQRIKPIFEQALDREGDDRRAYLDQACGQDPRLRMQVEALLKANEAAGQFLESPVLEAQIGLCESPPTESPGTVIGRYKLLEKVGEGGMAVVYMAEQTEPIRRKVALKIIKLGMDTRQVIARFEAERQALALMDHPCIAKVLDAGATETGRPYFVMELVTGVSITEYCDRNSLSTKDRLALFLQVCNAVQHAHTKGIIHRDIKPSNVMVTHHDGKPVPKVIDFGIAKATNQKLTEKTLFTRYAHLIGTPAYMSPEQAELSDLDIDTRSDIYSLGVLLYELLTGTTPFSEEELRKAGYTEMQRIIREQEPAKPSTKLTTLGETLTDIARHRGCTPDLLRRAVRGDLDWIVMKSLEKDRTRRYEGSNALAEDIRRHLEHEPILARGPGATYRLHKFLRRHHTQVFAAGSLAIIAVAAGIGVWRWNQDRLRLAEAERFRDRGVLSQADEQYTKGDREPALETIQPILTSPYVGAQARLLQARILLGKRRPEDAAAILNGLLDQPREVAGAAYGLLAQILRESESLDAEKLRQFREYGQKAEILLQGSAEAYYQRAMGAVTIKEQLDALDRALQLDPKHYETRRSRAFTYYASRKYERMNEDAVVLETLRDRDPLGYSLRATALRELGRYPEALAEYSKALSFPPGDSSQHLDLATQRCETLLRKGEYAGVLAETQACLSLWPDKPVFRYHRFCAFTALGDYDKAAVVFQEIVRTTPGARNEFWFWATKYVFDTLEAGRSWHPPDHAPAGAAFLPLVEAEETYRDLSAKAHRVALNGFSADWSPDGKKLAFSLGVYGYSGVALYDPATKETELLIVPGKDPRWSPDGKSIAFVRDCQALRLEELTATERKDQDRPWNDEEVWLMKSDGNEPRRLAQGGCPSWSRDGAQVYYHSRRESMLCSISIAGSNVEPKRIMACSSKFPSISPDEQQVAYLEYKSLTVKDLASQAVVAQWRVPFDTWGGPSWSPSGQEVCVGAGSNVGDRTGLWIYPLDSEEPVKVLTSQIMVASWAPDGTKLVFALRPPYFELWTAGLNPSTSTVETLGPGQTLAEHWQDMLRLYTRRIEADPMDAYAYSDRARYYDHVHERSKAEADMRRWSAAASGRLPSDVSFGAPLAIRRVLKLPLDCELVFSAERPVHAISTMSVACGQKGRWEMKLFEIPMVVTSLLGLGFLAGLDASPARADFTFGAPVNILSTLPSFDPVNDIMACFSADGLEAYIDSTRAGGKGNYDLWVCKRASVEDAWGLPENLAPANRGAWDGFASLTADGLELYFASGRSGGYGNGDLYVTQRATPDSPWGVPTNLGPNVNTPSMDWCSWVSSDGLELYFVSDRPGGYGRSDLYVSKRATTNDPWGPAANLGPVVNSPTDENCLALSPDGLVLVFQDNNGSTLRPGGYGGGDLWMTRRANRSAPWEPVVNLGRMVNTPTFEYRPCFAPDGSALYFGNDIGYWKAPIIPIVDFNGDGKVDGKEVLALAEHWGQSKSLFDIGLSPMGDGTVDTNDLTVLAGYIGQDVNDPTLIVHWALDETAGMMAADSAGDNDALVLGNAVWQPAGGKIGGALAFDGKDDFATTGQSVLDPAAGPFSVIAWVKGGGANRVIVSQASGADWLYLNQFGMLTTDLKSSGKDGTTLTSDAYVLDDQWHRVVLTWDGANRTLQMDGVEVAADTQTDLKASSGKLLIGVGKTMAATSFWSGLIDEVRIYNRAVQP